MRSKNKSFKISVKRILHLIFPQELIKKPVIYTVAKKYNIVPNIRRANITEKTGEITLQLSGKKEDLQRAENHLKKLNIKVEPVIGDILG